MDVGRSMLKEVWHLYITQNCMISLAYVCIYKYICLKATVKRVGGGEKVEI